MTVTFLPLNDQVLIKLDTVKQQSRIVQPNRKATVLPSGIVVAVGRGVFMPGVGWMPTQVAPGDHVALSMQDQWVRLPLDGDADGEQGAAARDVADAAPIYVTVSESSILGKLEGAEPGSSWFKQAEEEDDLPKRVKGRR